MRKCLWWCALLWLAALPPVHAAGAPLPEIAVSMRYFQQTGTSHAHLYLYRADGKLLRQLTHDDSAQDRDPVFAPDGASIVFRRVDDQGGKIAYWSIEPHGGGLHPLPAAPDWYAEAKSLPVFDVLEADDSAAQLIAPAAGSAAPAQGTPPTYRAPDGSGELILKVSPQNDEDGGDGPGHGKAYVWRDLRTNQTTELGTLPGFIGLFELLALNKDATQRFLLAPPLRAAFFALHLNSTDGGTVFALDLNARRLVRLSPNWAAPFPLPGEPAFLTMTENRYVPFGDGHHTANCSFIEHWDAALNRVRYAREKAAGRCAGASMFRPGGEPAVVSIRAEE